MRCHGHAVFQSKQAVVNREARGFAILQGQVRKRWTSRVGKDGSIL